MRYAILLALLLPATALQAQFQSNNECATPTSLEIGVNPSPPFGQTGVSYGNTFASDSAGFSPFNCAQIQKDVFFAVSPPCSGNYRVSLCTPPGFVAPSIADSVLEVYPFTACAGGGAPIACNDDACGLLSELTFNATAGVSYLLRVGSYSTTAPGSFYITVVPVDLPNNECATASVLAPGWNQGTTDCASPSQATTCPGFSPTASDAWHQFTPTADCLFSVQLTGSGADNLAVYSGSCSALSPLACLAGQPPLQTATLLAAAGTTYFVRVGETEFNGIGGFGAYSLNLECTTSGSSDECTGAVPVFDGVNPAAPQGVPGFAFSNVGATDSAGFATPCGSGGHHDVFFQYYSLVDGPVRVATCAPGGGFNFNLADTVLSVYPASACGGGGPPLACNDDACAYESSLTFTATYATMYLIRVASFAAGSTGSFYLTIDPSVNETCATAQPLVDNLVHGSTVGAEIDGAVLCFGGASVWYSVVTTSLCDVRVDFTAANPGTTMSLASGSCGPGQWTHDCGVAGQTYSLTAPEVPAGTTIFIEVVATSGTPRGPFVFQWTMDKPANDTAANPTPVVVGVNPSGVNGNPGAPFSNVGAISDPSPVGCPFAFHYNDVFFSYVADCDGPVAVTTEPPPGYVTGFYFDPLIAVYSTQFPYPSAPAIACNDDLAIGSIHARVVFNAVAGASYLIRVASYQLYAPMGEGGFYLTISRDFCLTMDAPLGPGSIRIRNLGGPPYAACLSFFTVFSGSYPNGPFFGIDPMVPELVQQLLSPGPPFFNVLDAAGGSQFGPLTGAPSGLTLYAVSVALNGYFFGQATAPTSFTIP